MVRDLLCLVCVAFAMTGCGPAGGGPTGGGTGAKVQVPNFHGQFTVETHTNDGATTAGNDIVARYTMDLQATRDDGDNGWVITGTAAIDSLTYNDNGHCQYAVTGTQVVNGTMLNPVDDRFNRDFVNGYVQFTMTGSGSDGLHISATKLDNYYANCTASGFWSVSLDSDDGSASYCTVTERDSLYNSNNAFDFKLNYDCSHDNQANGYTYHETDTANVTGTWVPN